MARHISIPRTSHYGLANATVPACLVDGLALTPDQDGLAQIDIAIADGRIADLQPAGSAIGGGLAVVDLAGRMVFPGFVEVHTHLDKGHIWPRSRNPDGSFQGALASAGADREQFWSAGDVRRRMDFALRTAYAHGTTAIRTHIDSRPPQDDISWGVLTETIADWRDRITLEGSSLFTLDLALDDGFLGSIARRVDRADGVLGAVTFPIPDLDRALDAMIRSAADYGLDLDFHVDETEDASVATLPRIAEAAIRHDFQGRILVGHCCSLARQDEATIARTLDLMARARMAVVSLPMCNLYLQDRHAGRTPRWRGVTLLHEMKARGIPVMIASDNTRDPFYAYGDLDPMEVFREAVRILHLDHPFGDWPAAISRTAADQMRLSDEGRIALHNRADLVLFHARDYSELLSRHQSSRVVLRAGDPIDTTLPDYSELDDLMRSAR